MKRPTPCSDLRSSIASSEVPPASKRNNANEHRGRNSAFEQLADFIDAGDVTTAKDYRALKKGDKSGGTCRVRALPCSRHTGVLSKETSPLDVALAAWAPSLSPVAGTAKVHVAHMFEREWRRLQHDSPESQWYLDGPGSRGVRKLMDARFAAQELVLHSFKQSGALAQRVKQVGGQLTYNLFFYYGCGAQCRLQR